MNPICSQVIAFPHGGAKSILATKIRRSDTYMLLSLNELRGVPVLPGAGK